MIEMAKIMRVVRRVSLAVLMVVAAQSGSVRAEPDLWYELRNGGIVLFRHALAPGTGDPAGFALDDCSTQRNLDARGRADSKQIGAMFRNKAIPVAKVLTSQWCRCRETARLAFPGQVEDAPAFNSFFQNRSREAAQTEEALELLKAWSGPGTLVVVTHQVNITALTGVFPASGEGIVVATNNGALTVVGRLKF